MTAGAADREGTDLHQAPASPWTIQQVGLFRGGPVVVPRDQAPLIRALPYRRAAGEGPAATGEAARLGGQGWEVDLGERRLGHVLFALGLARALADGTEHDELHYRGPRHRLMRRCTLPMTARPAEGANVVHTGHGGGRAVFTPEPEQPRAWLDVLDDDLVEVHTALPMRFYLDAEQLLGTRLPAARAPLPVFRSAERARPGHVVFVGTTSWPSRKDYGEAGFAAIAEAIARRRGTAVAATLIANAHERAPESAGFEVVTGLDAADCVDVFASAELVIGNDTGLTHLAALTERADGTGPEVIGLYGRHSHQRWSTGLARHHAVATPFSQMLTVGDRCPHMDKLDDGLWSDSASLSAIAPEVVAGFAGEVAGWW